MTASPLAPPTSTGSASRGDGGRTPEPGAPVVCARRGTPWPLATGDPFGRCGSHPTARLAIDGSFDHHLAVAGGGACDQQIDSRPDDSGVGAAQSDLLADDGEAFTR
jgi:hypothetical protein